MKVSGFRLAGLAVALTMSLDCGVLITAARADDDSLFNTSTTTSSGPVFIDPSSKLGNSAVGGSSYLNNQQPYGMNSTGTTGSANVDTSPAGMAKAYADSQAQQQAAFAASEAQRQSNLQQVQSQFNAQTAQKTGQKTGTTPDPYADAKVEFQDPDKAAPEKPPRLFNIR